MGALRGPASLCPALCPGKEAVEGGGCFRSSTRRGPGPPGWSMHGAGVGEQADGPQEACATGSAHLQSTAGLVWCIQEGVRPRQPFSSSKLVFVFEQLQLTLSPGKKQALRCNGSNCSTCSIPVPFVCLPMF